MTTVCKKDNSDKCSNPRSKNKSMCVKHYTLACSQQSRLGCSTALQVDYYRQAQHDNFGIHSYRRVLFASIVGVCPIALHRDAQNRYCRQYKRHRHQRFVVETLVGRDHQIPSVQSQTVQCKSGRRRKQSKCMQADADRNK